jgi:hypothetical protein
LILCEFHIMHPVPLIPFPCNRPANRIHTHTHTHTHARARASCSISQCVPQYISLSTHLPWQMFIAMGHWSGSRSLASVTPSALDPHRDSSRSSRGYPVSWRSCHFGSAGLAFP